MPAERLHTALRKGGVRRHNGIYSPLVILWLLVWQRLQGGAPLESAVFELLRGLPSSFWPSPCKRMRDWWEHGKTPSSHTGAYNQARQALPLSLVHQSCDQIFEGLTQTGRDPGYPPKHATFLLDGSTMRTAHTAALQKAYPPGSNQYREGHWPLLRILVAHDIHTGFAMRPEWGPVHGPDRVSEQELLERAIDRLPDGAAVLGDCNFGVFSVAYASTQRQHPVLLRLTKARAERLAGEALRNRMNRRIDWLPSPADRRRHPHLPADACIAGRLIVR